jgi:hypothetical protein
MERPKLRATRSMPSMSSFLGKSAAIRAYPGKKRTMTRPRGILIGREASGGTRVKIRVRTASPAAARRSP